MCYLWGPPMVRHEAPLHVHFKSQPMGFDYERYVKQTCRPTWISTVCWGKKGKKHYNISGPSRLDESSHWFLIVLLEEQSTSMWALVRCISNMLEWSYHSFKWYICAQSEGELPLSQGTYTYMQTYTYTHTHTYAYIHIYTVTHICAHIKGELAFTQVIHITYAHK